RLRPVAAAGRAYGSPGDARSLARVGVCMTSRLERRIQRAAKTAVRRAGENATRIRPVETVVNGQTVKDLDTDHLDVRVVITARSGEIQERGWGQTAAGEHVAIV